MIVIEEVFKSLDSNPNINEDAKNDLKSLIVIFNKNYPAIDLTHLNDKLSSLKVEGSSKLTVNSPMNYNPRNNVILANEEEIEKGYDVENLLMNCIIKMISSTNDSYGFVDNDKYAALNAGITAQIANQLVGNGESLVFDQDELIESNLISSIVGVENLFNAYFTNDKEFARSMFLSEKANNVSLDDVNVLMDYGYRANLDVSVLGDVEKKLIGILCSKERTNEQIELFENNLITNNIYMNYPDRYIDIDDVDRIYNEIKHNYAPTMADNYELNGRVK